MKKFGNGDAPFSAPNGDVTEGNAAELNRPTNQFFNAVYGEVKQVIESSGQTLAAFVNDDTRQVSKAAFAYATKGGAFNCSGTANAKTLFPQVGIIVAPSAILAGAEISFVNDIATTGAFTVSVFGLSNVPVFYNGAALTASQLIKIGETVRIKFDGTRFNLVSLNDFSVKNIALDYDLKFDGSNEGGALIDSMQRGRVVTVGKGALVATLSGSSSTYFLANSDRLRVFTTATITLDRGKLMYANDALRVIVWNPTLWPITEFRTFLYAIMAKQTAVVSVQIEDGFHAVTGYLADVTGMMRLTSKNELAPTALQITGATIALNSGDLFAATVNLATALPARVVAGYAVGLANVKGSDKKICSINGAHKVKTIAADRLGFTFDFFSYGASPVGTFTVDNTAALGLVPNICHVPQHSILVTPPDVSVPPQDQWTGTAREGFINSLRDGKTGLKFIGVAYNGVRSEHDMLFAATGGVIDVEDFCVIAGTGDKTLRTGTDGSIRANRLIMGGGGTGQEAFQGVSGSTIQLTRCVMGGYDVSGVTATADTRIVVTQSIIASCKNTAVRTTYPSSSIDFLNSRIYHCGFGIDADQGTISTDTNVEIDNCDSAFLIRQGSVFGDPVITNTGITQAPMALQPQGGAWVRDLARTYNLFDYVVGSVVQALDFAPVTAQNFAVIEVLVAGAESGDFVKIARLGSAEPALKLYYHGYVSDVGKVEIRCVNYGAATIDPTAFTARITVTREQGV